MSCVAQAQESVRLDFSFYYPGKTSESAAGSKNKALALVSDLHYGLGKKNIPLHIKQGRQTILYPYRGSRTFAVYRLGQKDGQETRDVVASVKIPSGTKKAIFLLLDDPKTKGGYRIHPFWMGNNVAKKGYIRILNMSGREVALLFDKGKSGKGVLKKSAAYSIRGKFAGGQKDWFTTMEGFVTRHKDKPFQSKVIHRDLIADKDDTSVYLVVRKQQHFLELLSLSLSGADNPIQKDRVRKQIKPEDLKPGQA